MIGPDNITHDREHIPSTLEQHHDSAERVRHTLDNEQDQFAESILAVLGEQKQ